MIILRINKILFVCLCPSDVTTYLNSYLSCVLIDEIIYDGDLRSTKKHFDTKRKKHLVFL